MVDYKAWKKAEWEAKRRSSRRRLAQEYHILKVSSLDDAPDNLRRYELTHEVSGCPAQSMGGLNRGRFLNKLAETYAEAYCPRSGDAIYGYTKKTIMNVLHIPFFDTEKAGERIYSLLVKSIGRHINANL